MIDAEEKIQQAEIIRRSRIVQSVRETEFWPLFKQVAEEMNRQYLAVSQSVQQAHLSHGYAGAAKAVLDIFDYFDNLPAEKQALIEQIARS